MELVSVKCKQTAVKKCKQSTVRKKNFLSFRFYVKSILGNVEVLKMQFLGILVALNFVRWVSKYQDEKRAKMNKKKSRFKACKCVKMTDFAILESPKLISIKI